MARFLLTAQLQLRAPANTRQVVAQMQRQLRGVNVPVNVNARAANTQMRQLTSNVNAANSAGQRMNRTFATSVRRFAAFSVASRAISLFTTKLSSGIQAAIDFERELVKISQVSGKTVQELQGLSNTITSLSTNLGTSSKALLSTGRILAQAGIQAKDLDVALSALAKTTLAPTFDDITKTAEGAVAILAQFGRGVGALEEQLGAINAVAGQFAVESGDLISAVRRTGGVFKSAGGDLNELIGLFTSVRATTRESAESIATGLRTIFTRIQRPKTIEFLKQFGVELTDLSGKFVGPFEAVKQLSRAFKDLEEGDITFVRVAEELGGFRQIGKVIPLLQQFEVAERARAAAVKGASSLDRDAATAQQALAVQIEKTREKFLQLVRDIAGTGTFKSLVTTTLSLADAFIKVADALKPIIPLVGALAGIRLLGALGGIGRGFGAGIRNRNSGGPIGFNQGGLVPGTGNTDTVPAMLTAGEYVIRKNSVRKIGVDNLAALNATGYSGGGFVSARADQYSDTRGYSVPAKYAFTKKPQTKFDKSISRFNSEDKISFTRLPDEPVDVFSLYTPKEKEKDPNYLAYKNAVITKNNFARGNAFEKIVQNKKGVTLAVFNQGEATNDSPSSRLDGMFKNIPIEIKSRAEVIPDGELGRKVAGASLMDSPSSADRKFVNMLEATRLTNSKETKTPDEINFGPVQVMADVTNLAAVGGGKGETKKLGKGVGQKVKSVVGANSGGRIAGSDTVPAMLTPGEYVINRDAASSIGLNNLHRMNKHGVAGFAQGGLVARGRNNYGTTPSMIGGPYGLPVPAFSGSVGSGKIQKAIANFESSTGKLAHHLQIAQTRVRLNFERIGLKGKELASAMATANGVLQKNLTKNGNLKPGAMKQAYNAGVQGAFFGPSSVNNPQQSPANQKLVGSEMTERRKALDAIKKENSMRGKFSKIGDKLNTAYQKTLTSVNKGLKSVGTFLNSTGPTQPQLAAAVGAGGKPAYNAPMIVPGVGPNNRTNPTPQPTSTAGTTGGTATTTSRTLGPNNSLPVVTGPQQPRLPNNLSPFQKGFNNFVDRRQGSRFMGGPGGPTLPVIQPGGEVTGGRNQITGQRNAPQASRMTPSNGRFFGTGNQRPTGTAPGAGGGMGSMAAVMALSMVPRFEDANEGAKAAGNSLLDFGMQAATVTMVVQMLGASATGLTARFLTAGTAIGGAAFAAYAAVEAIDAYTGVHKKAEEQIKKGNVGGAGGAAIASADAKTANKAIAVTVAAVAGLAFAFTSLATGPIILLGLAIGGILKFTGAFDGIRSKLSGLGITASDAAVRLKAMSEATTVREEEFRKSLDKQLEAANKKGDFKEVARISRENVRSKNIEANADIAALKAEERDLRKTATSGGFLGLQGEQAQKDLRAKTEEINNRRAELRSSRGEDLLNILNKSNVQNRIASAGAIGKTLNPEDLVKEFFPEGVGLEDVDAGSRKAFIQSLEDMGSAAQRNAKQLQALNFGLNSVNAAAQGTVSALERFMESRETGTFDSSSVLEQALTSAASSLNPKELQVAQKELASTMAGFGASSSQIAEAQQSIGAISQLQSFGEDAFRTATRGMAFTGGSAQVEEIFEKTKEELGKRLVGVPESIRKKVFDSFGSLDENLLKEAFVSKDFSKVFQSLLDPVSEALKENVLSLQESQDKIDKDLASLYKTRIDIEKKFVSAQKENLRLQQEAAEIIADITGKTLSASERAAFADKQARTSLGAGQDLSAAGLQRRSSIAAQQSINARNAIARGARDPNSRLSAQQSAFATGAIENSEQTQKDILDYARERIKIYKDEIQAAKDKLKLEKEAANAFISGDQEAQFTALESIAAKDAFLKGNTGILRNISGEARSKAFDSLTDEEKKSANVQRGLRSLGMTAELAQAATETTPEIQKLENEAIKMAQVISRVGDNLEKLAKNSFDQSNIDIQTAQIIVRNTSNSGQSGMPAQQPSVPAQRRSRGGVIYANNGIFVPRGTDTVPAMLTPGEFVVNRAAVQRGNNLHILKAMNNGGAKATGYSRGGVAYLDEGAHVLRNTSNTSLSFSDGGGQITTGNQSSESSFEKAIKTMNTSMNTFSSAVDRLIGFDFKLKLDPVNVTVSINSGGLNNELKDQVLTAVADEIRINQLGQLERPNRKMGGLGGMKA